MGKKGLYMKNLLIIGVPRSGKSTLANMMSNKCGFDLISIDAIVATFSKIFPELGIHLEPEKSEPVLSKFIFEYLHQLCQESPKRKFIIEGCHLSPETVAKNLDLEQCKVICLGYPTLSPEQFLVRARQTDWAPNKDDNELIKMGEYFIKQSKLHQSVCAQHNIQFIDTSNDCQETLCHIMENVICR